jgi:hypothetical protein
MREEVFAQSDGQTNEWEIMGYDAQKGTITYGALIYSRE